MLPATPLPSDVRQKGPPMRTPYLPSDADRALEEACRDVEGTVSRLAKIVLHASALADRMDATARTDRSAGRAQLEHVRVLRQAAEAGRRAIWQAGLTASSPRPVVGPQPCR